MARRGFTIVELLIVIVVIAVLAVIIIISYNGITSQATIAAASSTLDSASRKITLYKVQNDVLPPDLNTAGVVANNGDSFVYRKYDSNAEFCLSWTHAGNSYFMNSSTGSTVTSGSCADPISIVGAGTPVGVNNADSTTVSLSSPITGDASLTFYLVADVIDTTSAWHKVASLAPTSSTNRVSFQFGDTGSVSMGYRIDTATEANLTSYQSNRVAGRHINWIEIENGATLREYASDQVAVSKTSSMAAGTGWSFTGIQLGDATSSEVPVMAIVYDTAHTQQVRARVMAYLAYLYNISATY